MRRWLSRPAQWHWPLDSKEPASSYRLQSACLALGLLTLHSSPSSPVQPLWLQQQRSLKWSSEMLIYCRARRFFAVCLRLSTGAMMQ